MLHVLSFGFSCSFRNMVGHILPSFLNIPCSIVRIIKISRISRNGRSYSSESKSHARVRLHVQPLVTKQVRYAHAHCTAVAARRRPGVVFAHQLLREAATHVSRCTTCTCHTVHVPLHVYIDILSMPMSPALPRFLIMPLIHIFPLASSAS